MCPVCRVTHDRVTNRRFHFRDQHAKAIVVQHVNHFANQFIFLMILLVHYVRYMNLMTQVVQMLFVTLGSMIFMTIFNR